MATCLKTTDDTARKPPEFGVGKLLFAVVLAVMFFLLVQSMQRHRFFQGGRVHRYGAIFQFGSVLRSQEGGDATHPD
jgi:hypothetical protein